MSLTIIVPSCRPQISTLASLNTCPKDYEVVTSQANGLGHARNKGAEKASTDLLVFLDDDLTVKPSLWHHILALQKREFAMTFKQDFPYARVTAIHARDFWRIGGFNSKIQVTGEDRDFYARAVKSGLHFKPIPPNCISHKNHARRTENIHLAICGVCENVQFLLKFGGCFPKVFRVDYFNRLKKLQIRTLLMQTLAFYYYLVRGVKT